MSEENDFVSETLAAEETNPFTSATLDSQEFHQSGTVIMASGRQPYFDGLNPYQLEQARAMIREEIAEAMKQLINEPTRKLVHEIEMYPKQDSM